MHSRFKLSVLSTTIFLAACSVKPVMISEQEQQLQIKEDQQLLFSDQEAISAPLTLHQAMARAIKYNLDHRLKLMEEALSYDMLDVAKLDMLPQLVYNAGYRGRSNDSGSSSKSLITGAESLQVSTSQERDRNVADLGLSWSMLDFGVSYYRAKQQADRLVIVNERRRKVIHNIIQNVRGAYWRALTAQNVMKNLNPLMKRMREALQAARKIENQGLKPPLESLRYQHRLLNSLRKLYTVKKNLIGAKVELAALMSLTPGTGFQLASAKQDTPEISQSVADLEQLALLKRPELREERYHDRISALEVKRTMASLMPSLNLNATYNYDSNKYTKNKNWFDFSALISGNLMDIITLKQRMKLVKGQAKVVDTRRMALNIAVLSQVQIAMLDFSEAAHIYNTDKELSNIGNRLFKQANASIKSQSGSELEGIEYEINAVLGDLHKGQSYADMQSAYGRVYLSVGADPLPESVKDYDIKTLSGALAEGESYWKQLKITVE